MKFCAKENCFCNSTKSLRIDREKGIVWSYTTIVGAYNPQLGWAFELEKFSRTTTRHIKEAQAFLGVKQKTYIQNVKQILGGV